MDSVHQFKLWLLYSVHLLRGRLPDEQEPGGRPGHLTTSEHPDFLAAAIRDIAARHGVGIPAPASR